MISRRGLIVQNVHRTVVGSNHRVQPAIVVNIAYSHASPYPRLFENAAPGSRNIRKFSFCITNQNGWLTVAQIGRGQFNIVYVMSLGDEQVLPAIVVDVHETKSPP